MFQFGNTLTSTAVTGQQLLDYLNVVALMSANDGAFVHFSGVEMVITGGEVVAKGAEKKGTTKGTKKSFSFVAFVPLWFKAFMLFATPSFAGMTVVVCGVGMGFNASVH